MNKDISVRVMFITGIFGFLSGSFIISTLIFATAAVFSNLHFGAEMQEEIRQTAD
jgi:CheY-specific phosphatase CheX